MSTLGVLKTRIATDLGRSDITSASDVVSNAIADAIDELGDIPFYFLMEESTGSTVAGDPNLALPDNFRRMYMVSVTVGSDRKDLPPDRNQIPYNEYRSRVWNTTSRGEPCDWALWDGQIWFDPVPDAVYTITFSYWGPEVGVPANDGSSNAWTTDAAQLVRAKAKALIFRDRIRNLEQAQVQEGVALTWQRKLLSRSRAQSLTGYMRPRRF